MARLVPDPDHDPEVAARAGAEVAARSERVGEQLAGRLVAWIWEHRHTPDGRLDPAITLRAATAALERSTPAAPEDPHQ